MILCLPELIILCVAFFSGDGAYATDGLRLTTLALGIRDGNVHPRTVRMATKLVAARSPGC